MSSGDDQRWRTARANFKALREIGWDCSELEEDENGDPTFTCFVPRKGRQRRTFESDAEGRTVLAVRMLVPIKDQPSRARGRLKPK